LLITNSYVELHLKKKPPLAQPPNGRPDKQIKAKKVENLMKATINACVFEQHNKIKIIRITMIIINTERY
jgi:hypothetical protein